MRKNINKNAVNNAIQQSQDAMRECGLPEDAMQALETIAMQNMAPQHKEGSMTNFVIGAYFQAARTLINRTCPEKVVGFAINGDSSWLYVDGEPVWEEGRFEV